jgi:uncharacterized protein YndB with AHSA1/START domain
MMRVTRTAVIEAAPDAVWEVVSSVERLPDWLVFAESAETVEGHEAGRLQRIHGRWGSRRSEVDQRITAFEPARRLAWRHEGERLDGRPAPRFAAETRFEVRLEREAGGTRVTMESVQVPASALKGLVMRLFGTRDLARGYERSLRQLDAVVSASRV